MSVLCLNEKAHVRNFFSSWSVNKQEIGTNRKTGNCARNAPVNIIETIYSWNWNDFIHVFWSNEIRRNIKGSPIFTYLCWNNSPDEKCLSQSTMRMNSSCLACPHWMPIYERINFHSNSQSCENMAWNIAHYILLWC